MLGVKERGERSIRELDDICLGDSTDSFLSIFPLSESTHQRPHHRILSSFQTK